MLVGVMPETLPTTDTTVRLGHALGAAFEVTRLIGRGGFAEVYEVRDTELRRPLAVKVLRPDLPWGPRTMARFLQEARTLARLNHPNTLPIFFAGEGEGLVYYAMPCLDGGSLAELLRRDGPLSVARAVALITPIIDALGHAHEHGIVHRDVKPDNIVIETGTDRPLLVDFGIARSLDGEGRHTEAGFVVGTPLYMSPEQALGHPDVDARADLYAVGAVLFEMLTGRPPFPGNDSQEIVGLHLTQPVPVAAISREGIPTWIRGVIVRCLAKRPEDRYPSAAALLDALRNEEMPAGVSLDAAAATPGRPTGDPVANAPTIRLPAARPAPNRWRRTAVALTVLTVCSGAVAAGVNYWPEKPPATVAAIPEAMLIAENRLLEPVSISVGDQALVLEPGDQTRLSVPAGRLLEAHWALVRPSARDGRALGEPFEGTFTAEHPMGELHAVIAANDAGRQRVVPFIVNTTPHAVRVSVVGPSDSAECGCFVPAGDSLALGYYAAAPEMAVRVTDVLGRTGRIEGFVASAQPETGRVRVQIDAADLRRLGP